MFWFGAEVGTCLAIAGSGAAAVTTAYIDSKNNKSSDEIKKDVIKNAAKGYKWGAIIGATVGIFYKGVNPGRIPTPRESELAVEKMYKGASQVSYKNGVEVPMGTEGSTRPDLVRLVKGKLEAIEVKNYDLVKNLSGLRSKLKSQILDRVEHLPKGSIQRVILDIRGRGYSKKWAEAIAKSLELYLQKFDPSVVVELLS